jgi:exonuclease III
VRAQLRNAPPLVWAGDLNVTHTAQDSTGGDDSTSGDDDSLGNQVQPSTAENARARFSQLLTAHGLTDVWRDHHPVKPGDGPPPRESAAYTWRGGEGKYEGKAQRIDYFCVSEQFAAERVESCEILGHGDDRNNRIGFLGSDHAPIKLTLKPSPPCER